MPHPVWHNPGSSPIIAVMSYVITNDQKQQAANWFQQLRDDLCAALSDIDGKLFTRTPWQRDGGGGGEMSVLKDGNVFEKAGVNISTVHGEFAPQFRDKIPGASENPQFWASGISVVIHPRNPHVPISHFNTRLVITEKSWFGGGGDLTPVFPISEQTAHFHAAFKQACDAHHPEYYTKYKQWCDDYFFLKHRNEPRGVGGIFYDYLENQSDTDFQQNFHFTQDVGKAFLKVYPEIVLMNINKIANDNDKQAQLMKRGRYVEFNLLYDRGTRFGLETNGNIEAILMSLPPLASW